MAKVGKFNTFPTITTGLEGIQVKVADLLDKLNELPLETVLNDIDVTLKQVTHTLAAADKTVDGLNTILENKDTQQMPEYINTTLDELRLVLKGLSPDSALYQDLSDSIEQLNTTLRNIESLTYTIGTKPNSLIFSKPKQQDLQPEAVTK
jgi:paraquat-inducible protein B